MSGKMNGMKIFITILIVFLLKWMGLQWISTDEFYLVVPRSMTGIYFFNPITYFDFLLPLSILLLHFRDLSKLLTQFSLNYKKSILMVLTFIMLPLSVSLLLYKYVQFYFLEFTAKFLLNNVYFISSFIGIQLILNQIKSKWLRILAGLSMVFILGIMGNFFTQYDSITSFFAIIGSQGMLLAISVFSYRKIFKKEPFTAILAALILAIITNSMIIGMRSDSYFTLFFVLLASWIGLLVSNLSSLKRILFAYGIFILLSVFMNFGFTHWMEIKGRILSENNLNDTNYRENFYGIHVHYNDSSIKDIAKNLAFILKAAEEVSKEKFGFAPEVKNLFIYENGPGGFYAEYPSTIRGRFYNSSMVELFRDSLFLNRDTFNIHFPDPVNAILHEYSHLYGTVPYNPWLMGAEEEGWATYSATVLAELIYQKYGTSAWKPSYPFHLIAKRIRELNLSGKAVFWSHPGEFTGFQLWHEIGKKIGRKQLYQKRWELTKRNGYRLAIIENNPSMA
ncbi:MAG: hypothetical protein D6834_03010, partial [Aquificota bacterium]